MQNGTGDLVILGFRIVLAGAELLAFSVFRTGVLLVLGMLAFLANPLVAVVQSLAGEGSDVLLAVGAFVSTFFATGHVHCTVMVFRDDENTEKPVTGATVAT